VESSVHPFNPYFICCWEQLHSKTQLAVRPWHLFYELKLKFSRYRRVPTFGRGTIRRFCNNAASMKKLAARDFEDLLQVCFFKIKNHVELLLIHPSVQYLFLKAFFLNRTTPLSSTSCLYYVPGMHVPSFVSIPP
jgi:hypothetical protein